MGRSLEKEKGSDEISSWKGRSYCMNTKRVPHYAMTLGGYRTSLSYPVLSSHSDMPEEERLKIGITNGLMRISCGIENTQDLVNDFLAALETAYGA